MRVGIVGTGFMGRTHAAAWSHTPATIAGYISKRTASSEVLIEKYGGKSYPDLAELLSDVDIVDICSPTHLHYEMVLEAAAAGCDIICEKPIARTLAQAQEMITACTEAGVKFFVAHVVRFFPEYAAAKAKVQSGEIGQPAVIRLTRGTFQPKKAIDNWFLDFEKSGGMMLDLMIHDLDYARWVAGEVDTVFARNIQHSHTDATVDHGLVILQHTNGTISHIEGSWAYPAPLFRTRLEIAGSNGWINYDSEETAAIGLHLHKHGREETPDVPLPSSPLSEDPFTSQIRSAYNSIAGDLPIAVAGLDGAAALQLALAAIESASSGQPVRIEPLTGIKNVARS